jgi:hypothetical protein
MSSKVPGRGRSYTEDEDMLETCVANMDDQLLEHTKPTDLEMRKSAVDLVTDV